MAYRPRAHSPASEFGGEMTLGEIRRYAIDSELLDEVEEAQTEKRAHEKFKGIEQHEERQHE